MAQKFPYTKPPRLNRLEACWICIDWLCFVR